MAYALACEGKLIMNAHVHVENLTFAFAKRGTLFENLSFHLSKGECLGITGPSGCGKSTLAQVLAGHLQAKSGHISVNGKPIEHPCRDVFLVHQESDLFPWLTVERQIAFGLKAPADIRPLLKLTRLESFEKYYPHQLSGGMKKRLSIARALAVGAQLLIFDESFNSLDFEMRREIFHDLKIIQQSTATTIIVISHDPRDLAHMADKELRLGERR